MQGHRAHCFTRVFKQCFVIKASAESDTQDKHLLFEEVDKESLFAYCIMPHGSSVFIFSVCVELMVMNIKPQPQRT